MRESFHHEALYRGKEALARLGRARLVVCGAGAVGSNLVDNLARQGFRSIRVIDDDRVESHNVGTQTYGSGDVGAFKAEVLQADVFRAVGVEIEAERKRLTEKNVEKLLGGADVVIDGFDNTTSRRLVAESCRKSGTACLHVGMSADYAEVLWNDGYRVPQEGAGGVDVCDYPLARNLTQFAVALASEALVRYVLTGFRQNTSFTLNDLRINIESA
jgi:molybdopterin/thiamine biosynthesis adenylyltransferase